MGDDETLQNLNSNLASLQITQQEFEVLKRKIMKDRGFDLSYYTPAYVQRRINACLMRRNCTFTEYMLALDQDPEEYQMFFDSFTINVTEFFRDPTVWRVLLSEYMPMLLLEKIAENKKTLRIWSAGCASGEEPYSIAMTLKDSIENLHKYIKQAYKAPGSEALPPLSAFHKNRVWSVSDFVISIYATDIDGDSLEKAEMGIYPKENIKNVSPEIMDKFFSPVSIIPKGSTNPQNCYKISNIIKQMVIFRNHHFFNHQSFSGMDMIFCRNVAIYFTSQMKNALLEIFYNSLGSHGMLVTGKAEAIFTRTKNLFYPLNLKEHIYRKERRSENQPPEFPDDKRKNL